MNFPEEFHYNYKPRHVLFYYNQNSLYHFLYIGKLPNHYWIGKRNHSDKIEWNILSHSNVPRYKNWIGMFELNNRTFMVQRNITNFKDSYRVYEVLNLSSMNLTFVSNLHDFLNCNQNNHRVLFKYIITNMIRISTLIIAILSFIISLFYIYFCKLLYFFYHYFYIFLYIFNISFYYSKKKSI